jgi:hypothetical protein
MGKSCPKCGKENEEGANFCEDCGANIPDSGSIKEPLNEPIKKPVGKPLGKPLGKTVNKPVQESTRPKESEGFLSKHGLKLAIGVGVCCVGILIIIGIFGFLSLDQNTLDLTDNSSSTSNDSGNGTWHSVANFTGSGYDNTTSFNIKGSKFKIKISATTDSLQYAYFSLFAYSTDNNLSVGQDTIENFSKTTETRELMVDDGPGNYYISIIAANIGKWKVEVLDYY